MEQPPDLTPADLAAARETIDPGSTAALPIPERLTALRLQRQALLAELREISDAAQRFPEQSETAADEMATLRHKLTALDRSIAEAQLQNQSRN